MKNVDLTIKFSSQDELDEFVTWLSDSGEQDYYHWMEYGEDRPRVDFNYHGRRKNTIFTKPSPQEDFA